MLSINTAIVSVLGISLNNVISLTTSLRLLQIPIAFIGLLFCYVWYITTIRGFATNKYWPYSVRELEYLISNKKIKQFTRGNEFRQNNLVSFRFGPKSDDLFYYQRPSSARPFNTEQAAYFIINVFACAYEILLLLGLYSAIPKYIFGY